MKLEPFTELEEVNWRLQVVMVRSEKSKVLREAKRMLRRPRTQEHLHACEEGGAPLRISSHRVPSNALSGLFSPGSMHFTLFCAEFPPSFFVFLGGLFCFQCLFQVKRLSQGAPSTDNIKIN